MYLVACGGGGSSNSSIPSAVLAKPNAVTTAAALAPTVVTTPSINGGVMSVSGGAQNFSLPSTSHYKGIFSIIANASPPAATVLRVSATESQRVAAAERKAQVGYERTPIYSVTISANAQLMLQGFPTFSIDADSFVGLDPKTLTYQVYEDAGCANGLVASAAATGISGKTATFNAVTTPLTLQAGHGYTFVFYKTLPIVDTKSIIYTAIPDTNTIIGVTLDENGTPAIARKISGSATGLDRPIDLAVDLDGKLYVLNAADLTKPADATNPPKRQSIVEFAPLADGNVSPVTTITDINQNGSVSHIGVSNSRTLFVSYDGSYSGNNHDPFPNRWDPPIFEQVTRGGYFTYAPGGIRGGNIGGEGVMLLFAVSPDDRIAELTYFESYSAGGGDSPHSEMHKDLRIGSALENNVSGPYSAIAFDPTNGAFIRALTSVIITSANNIATRGFQIGGTSDVSAIAFNNAGTFYAIGKPVADVNAQSLDIFENPFATPSTVIDEPPVFPPDHRFLWGEFTDHKAVSGLAVGAR